MTEKEIYNEMKMSYADLCAYLIKKYGGAISDYFCTPECKSKSKKVSRTHEGLQCHHMDEDKGFCLSNSSCAKSQPFEWQKKERLVYCNMLEHLMLHMKLGVLTSGVYFLCQVINDMFMNNGMTVLWRKRCFEEIRDNYNEYIVLLKTITSYIDTTYRGKKPRPLVPGYILHIAGCDCEVITISESKNEVLLKLPSGRIKIFPTTTSNQLGNMDCVDSTIRKLSRGYDLFYEKIYEDIKKPHDTRIIDEYCLFLSGDDDEPDYFPSIVVNSSVLTEEYNMQLNPISAISSPSS